MNRPNWLDNNKSTRARSFKQESRIAKDLKGKQTINSGATFGENDVVTDYCEIEAKTTAKKSFKFDLETFDKLERKTKVGKLPIMCIDFETEKNSNFVLMKYSDFKYLIDKANGK